MQFGMCVCVCVCVCVRAAQDGDQNWHNSTHQFSLDGHPLPLRTLPQMLLLTDFKSLVSIMLCLSVCVFDTSSFYVCFCFEFLSFSKTIPNSLM